MSELFFPALRWLPVLAGRLGDGEKDAQGEFTGQGAEEPVRG